LKRLDSRFHGNDKIVHISTFYETVKFDAPVKSRISTLPRSGRGQALSFPQKRESSSFKYLWTPAFAGVTRFGLFTGASNLNMWTYEGAGITIIIPDPRISCNLLFAFHNLRRMNEQL